MANVKNGAKATAPKKVAKSLDYERLGFGKLANSDNGSIEPICTVKEAAGNGQFGFTERNWKRAVAKQKLLTVKIVNPDVEQPAFIVCSAAVNDMILSGELKITHLAGLDICEITQEDGEKRLKICLPQGSSSDQMVDADAVNEEKLEFGSGDFLPEDLLGF